MTPTLHICYVELGYPHHHGGGGGAGTYVRLAGRELVRQGHRVSVVALACPQCPSYAIDEGIEVHRVSLGGKLHWYASKLPAIRSGAIVARYLEQTWSLARFVRALHARQQFDLVEYTEGGDFWNRGRAPFPFIVHLHGSRYTFLRMSGRPIDRAERIYRRLELLFIGRARLVFSPSQALIGLVAGELGRPIRRSAVLPYPLDPALLGDQLGEPAPASQRPTVLFAARNDPVKGGDTLLRAAPLVQREIADVEFRCFGYRPAPGAALPDYVRCYDFVAKDALLAHYRRADVCVVPSLWDNSPNTVYEAMAAGKPVVASRVGGIPELVSDGETGLLVEPGDHHQLAQALVRLLRDQRERATMGQSGNERIRRIANLNHNVEQRLAIYRQIIAERASDHQDRHNAHRTR